MTNLSSFTSISSTNSIDKTPQPIPILSQLVANKFEKLGISKKYTGFRYLVDFLRITLSNRDIKLNYCNTLDIVATLNSSTRDIVDRDIRHILLSSWENGNHLRSTISLSDQQPGAKQILYALIDYIQRII